MNKTKEATDTMNCQYLASAIVRGRVQENRGECFEILLKGGKCIINAESELAAAWASKQASEALKSGFLLEVLGKTKPLYPLRPLWIKAGNVSELLEKWIPFGFNAVVVESDRCEIPDGVKVILRPEIDWGKCCSPLDASYVQYLKKTLSPIEADYIFWESRCSDPSFFSHEDGQYLTRIEILQKEMKLLEEIAGKKRLIYHLPNLSRMLQGLCLAAGKNTVLAFSGDAFWKEIRQSLVPITAPLLPIIPAELSLGELARIFSLMKRHCFSGVLAMIQASPKDDRSLRDIGQLQLNP